MRGKGRRKEFLSGETLKKFLKGSKVKLVVLNACHSEALVVSLSEVVPAAIGTTRVIRDVVARQFTRNFYGALKDNATVKEAFDAALTQGKQGSPAYMHAGGDFEFRMDHGRNSRSVATHQRADSFDRQSLQENYQT